MLQLPSVTLVMVETQEHELAKLAIEDSLRDVHFGRVLAFSDEPSRFANIVGMDAVYEVPNWLEKIGWSRFVWQDLAPYLDTSHVLTIQWDSWVVNAEAWTDEFLAYDYIGAPWWYKDRNVGNGGFSIRTTALQRFLRKHRDRFPCITDVDDDLLCRKYRFALEEHGFTWAPELVAKRFAFECVQPKDGEGLPFGFHAAFNFGKVLDHERLKNRASLMAGSPYLAGKGSRIWKSFSEKHPEIIKELQESGVLGVDGKQAENVWIQR